MSRRDKAVRGKKKAAAAKPRLPLLAAGRYVLYAVLPAVAVVGLAWAGLKTTKSALKMTSVTMSGNEHLADEEVANLAGLEQGEWLPAIRGSEVRKRLMASPWIRGAAVRKEYPHSLELHIREAKPFALLDMKGKLFIIDEEGRMLEELRSDSIPFLPVIASNPYEQKEAYSEAVRLTKAIRKSEALAKRERIEVLGRSLKDLAAVLDGVLVKFGEGQYEDKLERLAEVEQEVSKKQIPIDYIDLRFARQVVVKPVTEVIR